ncbi:sigma factor-like helix-turn-helix DNA-binding protein [Olivibacter ginsenosidimutans]
MKEYRLFIEKAMNDLPARTSEIFKLCREEGKSYEEAAMLIGVSKHAIKNHMVAAMKKLNMIIEKKLDITLALLTCLAAIQQLFYFFATLR